MNETDKMRLLNAFFHLAHGAYIPGQVVNIFSTQQNSNTEYTQFHENVHKILVEGTTLGRVACILGSLKCYKPKEYSERGFSDNYLLNYANYTRLIHEGCAIALAVFLDEFLGAFGSTRVKTKELHPAEEVEVANKIIDFINHSVISILRIAFENNYLGEKARKLEGENQVHFMQLMYLILRPVVARSLAMAILSPVISDSFIIDAYFSIDYCSVQMLSDVWGRYEKVVYSDSFEMAANSLKYIGYETMNELSESALHILNGKLELLEEGKNVFMRIEKSIIDAIAESFLINYSQPPDWNDLLVLSGVSERNDSKLPWLSENSEWYKYVQDFAVHKPQPSNRNPVEAVDSIASYKGGILASKETSFIIAEYAIQSIGNMQEEHNKILMIDMPYENLAKRLYGPGWCYILVIYEFDSSGEYINHKFVFDPCDMKIVREVRLLDSSSFCPNPLGTVVSLEDFDASARFRMKLKGLELCFTSKKPIKPTNDTQYQVIGIASGSSLCKITNENSLDVWSLVAPHMVLNAEKKLVPATKALAWVLRNGLIGHEKWRMYSFQSGE